MVRQLRHGSCDALQENLCKSVKALWSGVRAEAKTWDSQKLHEVSRLLQECCSLFALEGHFHECLEECGRLQKTASMRAVVDGLLGEGEKLVTVLDDEPDQSYDAIKSMGTYVDGVDLSAEKLSADDKDRLRAVVLAIGGFANKSWREGGDLPESSIVSLQTMQKIDKFLGNAVLSLQVQGLSEGVAVHQAHLAMTSKMCNGGAEYLDEALMLHHRCLRFTTTLKTLNDVDQIPMLLRLRSLVENAEGAFQTQKTSMMANLKTELVVKEKALAKLAGGAPNGADWLADFTSDKWEDLQARATETLAKINAQEMIASQALSKYEKYAGALDVAADADRVTQLNAMLARSYITKCSAVCLGFLTDALEGTVSKEKLRSRIQAEIHALRAQAIKESETLHPLLLGKVQLALVMRYV
eukprot:6491831-Amphidinium_carterae.1